MMRSSIVASAQHISILFSFPFFLFLRLITSDFARKTLCFFHFILKVGFSKLKGKNTTQCSCFRVLNVNIYFHPGVEEIKYLTVLLRLILKYLSYKYINNNSNNQNIPML